MNPLVSKLMINSPIMNMDRLEDAIAARPDVHRWTADSPVRFEIMKEGIKRGGGPGRTQMLPIMLPTVLGVRKSLTSLSENPADPQRHAPAELLAELETNLCEWGASSVGYTQVPERWIFQNKAILYANAIVMTMEMDRARIDTAPSMPAMAAVMEIYRDLGRIANQGADFLRQRGYSAHAGHPLMGLALYPPLAQAAGLGWMGANGLIVTPEHGPRVRLATIFTSIENLPCSAQNVHAWVEGFCAVCGVCIRDCPADAILPEPERHVNGRLTYVVNERCFPYFSDYYGCSVCIKVCPFNRIPYQALKERFEHKRLGGLFEL